MSHPVLRQMCCLYIACSCLSVDTLQRYEHEKYNKAATYCKANARPLPTVLYFNKGL